MGMAACKLRLHRICQRFSIKGEILNTCLRISAVLRSLPGLTENLFTLDNGPVAEVEGGMWCWVCVQELVRSYSKSGAILFGTKTLKAWR